MRAAEQDHPDIAREQARWKAHQGGIAASCVVFIDEIWIKTNMAPLRGWGPRRQRLAASTPIGHWKTMTFIGALRYDRISAPGWPYQRRTLHAPCREGAGSDNLGSHKGKRARDIIRARQAHLPPYSPDLNPIEQVFAKLKHLMRTAEPRTIEAAWRKAGYLLDLFSEKECANISETQGMLPYKNSTL
jgi:transposase